MTFLVYDGLLPCRTRSSCSWVALSTSPLPHPRLETVNSRALLPSFSQQIFLPKSLSPLAVPRTIFLLSVHVQTWRKPAGLSQSPSPAREPWGFRSTEQFQPDRKRKRKEKGGKKKKFRLYSGAKRATSHMHIKFSKRGGAAKVCIKRKHQPTKLSFLI